MEKPTVEYLFRIEPEDIPVRGNAMASGDAEADKRDEDVIIARLNRGEIEAWCMAIVTARTVVDGQEFVGEATLGACSCDSEKELQNHCFEHYDMKAEALEDLKRELVSRRDEGETAGELLKVLA